MNLLTVEQICRLLRNQMAFEDFNEMKDRKEFHGFKEKISNCLFEIADNIKHKLIEDKNG